MMTWFVAYTHPRAELLAGRHLENQGFAVYLPRYLKRRRHARKIDWVAAPLFPRYVFVGIDPERARWRAIGSTTGVAGLVCSGNEPTPVPSDVLDTIRARENADGHVTLNEATFNRGDPIRIAEGVLAGITGLFERIRDAERVTVMLELLGRKVRVETPLHTVRASS